VNGAEIREKHYDISQIENTYTPTAGRLPGYRSVAIEREYRGAGAGFGVVHHRA
jgi:hypothetical protein